VCVGPWSKNRRAADGGITLMEVAKWSTSAGVKIILQALNLLAEIDRYTLEMAMNVLHAVYRGVDARSTLQEWRFWLKKGVVPKEEKERQNYGYLQPPVLHNRF
jgi:hypothetical protein